MTLQAPITAGPLKQLGSRELLAAIIGFYEELQSRGALGDAPTDLLNALDAGDDAARELLEWMGGDRGTWPKAGASYVEWLA